MELAGGICLTAYGGIVVKIYMDTFLEGGGRTKKIAGWLPFIIWQTIVNSRVCGLSPEGIETGQNPGFNLVMNCLSMELLGVLAYQGLLWKRFLFPIGYVGLIMMTEGLVVFGLNGISTYRPSMAIYLLLSNVAMLFIVVGIRLSSKKWGCGEENIPARNCLMLLTGSGIILYYAIYRIARRAGTETIEVALWLCISALMLLAVNLCIYPVYGILLEDVWNRRKSNEYLKLVRLYKEQRELEREAREAVAQIKHDLKQNLIYMGELVQRGEYAMLQEMITKLLNETVQRSYLEGKTGNLVMDSLINHLWLEAKKKDFVLELEAHVDGAPHMDDTEMCALLGNLFDNAVEAVATEKERRIQVLLNYQKGYLYLSVSNSCTKELDYDRSGRIKSSKDGMHGLGLRSVERIIKKYHGTMEIKKEIDCFRIEVTAYC